MNSPQQDKKDMVIVYIHKHHQEIYDNLDRKMVFQWLGDFSVRKLDSPIIPFPTKKVEGLVRISIQQMRKPGTIVFKH